MKVSIDTRTIQPGDYFIPIQGPHFDGRAFIPEALKKGAHILDVDLTRYATQYRKKLHCPVIAITGSAGKTTAKDLISSVLGQLFTVVKTLENQNNEVGVPLTLLRADYETEAVVTELGMRHRGEIGHLASIVRPTHVVITNIGKSHIELLKTQRNIALAKGEIFKPALKWETQPRYAFLNYESPYYDLLVKKAQKAGYHSLPFGGQDKPEQNMQLAYAVGHHFGLHDEQIRLGISAYQGSAHRLKQKQINHITLIDDTYNANPDGVAYALQFLRRFEGRKWLILGDMLELGEHSETEHQQVVAQALDAGVSLLFTLGHQTAKITSPHLAHEAFLDKEGLHARLLPELKAGDVVLVKGSRGMKMEETVQFIEDHYA